MTVPNSMNTNKRETRPDQPPAYYSHLGSRQDEINLLDVFQALKQQWKFIVAVTSSFTLVALIIALILPKIYTVEVSLLPPLESDVEALNVSGLYKVTSEGLYADLIRNLNSKHLRRRFFDEHNLLNELKEGKNDDRNSYEIFRKRFDDLLLLEREEDFVLLFLDGTNPEQLAPWLNNYVKMVDAFTIESVVRTIKAKIKGQLSILNRKIEGLRVIAEKIRQDKLVQLEDALLMAQNLKIKDQDVELYFSFDSQSIQRDNKNKSYTALTDDYLKGGLILKAEIAELKKRKNNDPFIIGLREIQRQKYMLEKTDFQYKDLHAGRIDQQAKITDNPIKPNVKLIVVIGGIMGGLVAFFISIIMGLFVYNS